MHFLRTEEILRTGRRGGGPSLRFGSPLYALRPVGSDSRPSLPFGPGLFMARKAPMAAGDPEPSEGRPSLPFGPGLFMARKAPMAAGDPEPSEGPRPIFCEGGDRREVSF